LKSDSPPRLDTKRVSWKRIAVALVIAMSALQALNQYQEVKDQASGSHLLLTDEDVWRPPSRRGQFHIVPDRQPSAFPESPLDKPTGQDQSPQNATDSEGGKQPVKPGLFDDLVPRK